MVFRLEWFFVISRRHLAVGPSPARTRLSEPFFMPLSKERCIDFMSFHSDPTHQSETAAVVAPPPGATSGAVA